MMLSKIKAVFHPSLMRVLGTTCK